MPCDYGANETCDYGVQEFEIILNVILPAPQLRKGVCLVRVRTAADWQVVGFANDLADLKSRPKSPRLRELISSMLEIDSGQSPAWEGVEGIQVVHLCRAEVTNYQH